MIQNPHYDDSLNKGPKGDKGDTGAQGPAGTFTTFAADVSFGNHRIINLANPRDGADAVNKNYGDGRYIRAGEEINMGSNRITNLNDPADNNDALNRGYADTRYLRSGQNINLGSNSISSSSIPTADNDLVNKAYLAGIITIHNVNYNQLIPTNSVRFKHFFPNRGTTLIIWFNFTLGGESSKRINMQPYNVGLNNAVILHINSQASMEYIYDSTHITCTRIGTQSIVLNNINLLVKI